VSEDERRARLLASAGDVRRRVGRPRRRPIGYAGDVVGVADAVIPGRLGDRRSAVSLWMHDEARRVRRRSEEITLPFAMESRPNMRNEE
jgi:hypothetical protein